MTSLFDGTQPIIGMVHLDPLPGAPKATGDLSAVIEAAVRDAERLVTGGVDGLLIENYGDAPFYPDVPKHTVAAMTRLAVAVRRAVDCPVGINVLRNDPEAALSIAAAVEADFVRVNVHTGTAVTDQGVIEGRAHETLRLREQLGVDTAILADVDVKHATPLAGDRSIGDRVSDLVERGLADGVIVSGIATGEAVDTDTLDQAVAARTDRGLSTPILAGSGVTADSAAQLLSIADGAIVGTALKEGGRTTNPVDVDRVEQLMAAAEAART